jgi:hypothetical protein
MHTEVLNIIQVVSRALGYNIPLLTQTYHIYWLHTEISNSEVLRRATSVPTFRLPTAVCAKFEWSPLRFWFNAFINSLATHV